MAASAFGPALLAVAGLGAADEPVPDGVHRGADLPPLLRFLDGTPVRTAGDWPRRRAEVRDLLIRYFVGSFPERPPAIDEARVLEEADRGGGSRRRRVRLAFATPHRASFEMEVWIPPGAGPFPLLLTQPRHYQIGWAEMALARGYIVALYPGIDSHHQEKDYPGWEGVWEAFRKEYPAATWTEISGKAWIASRALDHLLDSRAGYPIAGGQVGIIGFSRYGKQALIAAAFDERIAAVVARSPGSPGSCPYRFTSTDTTSESAADFPDEWFRAGLRSFAGREDELPIDAHGWFALIAPRRCLIHAAHNDDSEPTFALERAYGEGKTVYRLLGRPDDLRILYRPGGHEPVTDEHRRQNLDWLDLSFGRGSAKDPDFPESRIHAFDWEAWRAAVPPALLAVPFPAASPADDADRRARIRWLLGEPPPSIPGAGRRDFLTAAESELMTHDRWAVPGTARIPVTFGEGVRGNVYLDPSLRGPAPAVIWLHPYSYPSGYNEGYGVTDTTVYHRLARAGFVVLAYDGCGFGLRLLEGRDFYRECPAWSRLGRLVHDVGRAVDFLADGKGEARRPLPAIRRDRIYALGHSLGGLVALHAAALDPRIAGVACFSGFTPWRTDTDAKPTGGSRRLWERHALVPRLGLFRGRESEAPYDADDLLRLIAPRPCLVVAPHGDRGADPADVASCIERARPAWGAGSRGRALDFRAPDGIARFRAAEQEAALAWLRAVEAGGE